MFDNINLDLKVERAPESLEVACTISSIDVAMRYSDYLCLRHIVRHNITRKVDRKRWDNLEVAWEKEQDEDQSNEEIVHESSKLVYSENARYVRFGQETRSTQPSSYKAKFGVSLASMGLTLYRDDHCCENTSMKPYSLVSANIDGIEFQFNRDDRNDYVYLSIQGLELKDMGEKGRFAYGHFPQTKLEHELSVFTTILDCYSPSEQLIEGSEATTNSDSPLIATLHINPIPSMEKKLTVVINGLNFVALPRPMDDMMQFFRCTWPSTIMDGVAIMQTSSASSANNTTSMNSADHENGSTNETSTAAMNDGDGTNGVSRTDGMNVGKPGQNVQASPEEQSLLQVKFVLHYPRLTMIADESDCHSRALVFRGYV
jgi:hypothetical protein